MVFTTAAAQQPVVKAGTQIDGKFLLYGQTVPVKMTVRTMTDSVLLDWNIRGATGSYLISAAAFQNGSLINFVQPAYLSVVRLAPDETFALISKNAFTSLKKNDRFVYNHTTYVTKQGVQEQMVDVSGQKFKVIHVIGVEEACELWILDDPTFPLICQINNNPLGINFLLTGIK